MIIGNGYIRIIKQVARGEIDALTGNPLTPASSYSSRIDAQITDKTSPFYKLSPNGINFVSSAYSILIDKENAAKVRGAKWIELYRGGSCLGQYQVQSITELDEVNNIQITV
ncbi:MAG: hypothetical protein PHU62_09855 [Bacteroidales bacterium]|nr:hypothetical protein [Bacteroidales bacterium]MDD4634853.1 hypothetical protein [Bacteroidales bacterium]